MMSFRMLKFTLSISSMSYCSSCFSGIEEVDLHRLFRYDTAEGCLRRPWGICFLSGIIVLPGAWHVQWAPGWEAAIPGGWYIGRPWRGLVFGQFCASSLVTRNTLITWAAPYCRRNFRRLGDIGGHGFLVFAQFKTACRTFDVVAIIFLVSRAFHFDAGSPREFPWWPYAHHATEVCRPRSSSCCAGPSHYWYWTAWVFWHRLHRYPEIFHGCFQQDLPLLHPSNTITPRVPCLSFWPACWLLSIKLWWAPPMEMGMPVHSSVYASEKRIVVKVWLDRSREVEKNFHQRNKPPPKDWACAGFHDAPAHVAIQVVVTGEYSHAGFFWSVFYVDGRGQPFCIPELLWLLSVRETMQPSLLLSTTTGFPLREGLKSARRRHRNCYSQRWLSWCIRLPDPCSLNLTGSPW